jgi:uncharacterized protein GlcG (DUF336 family)
MTQLTLAAAEQLARTATATARTRSMRAISVVVIDGTSNVKFALREDGAGSAGTDIALGKARAAFTFGVTSRQIADALSGNPLAGPSVLSVLQGRVVLLAGGAPLRDKAGTLLGAIAVAGDTPDNDEACALAAAATLT